MTNNATSAKGEAMPKLTRRAALTGAILSSAVLAVPFSGVAAGALQEEPELIALGEQIDIAASAFEAATEAKAKALAVYETMAPVVPEALVMRDGRQFLDGYRCVEYVGEQERNAEGATIWCANRYRWIATAEGLGRELGFADARTREGRMLRHRLKVAQQHEAAVTSARINSGLSEAIEAHYWAGDRMRRLNDAAAAAVARTPTGLAIKARAMVAAGQVDDWARGANGRNGASLASAVLNILGNAVV